MTDETNDTTEQSGDIEAKLKALEAEREALKGKVSELLGEAKSAKEKARAALLEAEKREREKAEAEGNFEQLFRSSEKEREQLTAQLDEMRGAVAKRETDSAAVKLAATLAEGENVQLLADFISRRLRHVDGEVKVVDAAGNLTVSTLDDLGKEFAGSARYASLIKGRSSSGGGAAGGSKSGGGAAEMSRADWMALNAIERAKFVREGGTLTD